MLSIQTRNMGCADSIIAATVEYPKQNRKFNNKKAKVQPAPLRGDKIEREDARARRQKAVAERHARAQTQAKSISDNAMAEKELLSNSTWKSSRSWVSNILSPAVSISVAGSDDSASPDNFPSPITAYQSADKPSESEVGYIDNEHASDMHDRTTELPNQVTDDSELANQRDCQSKLGHNNESSGYNSTNQCTEGKKEQKVTHSLTNSVPDVRVTETNNTTMFDGAQTTLNSTANGKSVEITKSYGQEESNQETATNVKGKKKAKTKHKEVKFIDQLSKLPHIPSEHGRKSTSQGR